MESFSLAFAASSSNNLTNVFSYNPANQITALTQSSLTYNYTEAQNRVGAYGVNSLNQYTSIDGLPVTHDANGNLIADGAGMTYTYDMENHLVATGGAKSSTLRYDVLGRLARISVNGITTDFHYDGDALVGEYVGAAQKRRYVHGGQVDEPLVQYNLDTGAKLYLFADHQGSIIAHTTNAGSVAQTNSYDPYGIPGSANSGRFGYTGQAWLKELGLNYYKARIYAPKLGRFLQTDPIFYKDDMNLYAYVGGDPIRGKDPTGLYLEIRGSKDFREKTRQQLEELKQTRTGSELVDGLDSDTNHWFVIDEETDGNTWAEPANRNRTDAESRNDAKDPARGSGGKIHHNPNAMTLAPTADGEKQTPPSVTLGHDLAHAKDYAEGTLDDSIDPATNAPRHEQKAMETENKIRKEMGLPERTRYQY